MVQKRFDPTAQLKISLTPDCNNNCAICLNETTRSENGQRTGLSLKVIRELIDEAATLGMVGTYWTGGEPLLEYENLLSLIEYSCEKGLVPTVVTNGGLIAARGNYREMNRRLLQRTGLYDLAPSEIVSSLKTAGLGRIYFSVDSNHNIKGSSDLEVADSVPTAVVASALEAFLEEGFGEVHHLEAIGHQLRITATSSGCWVEPTQKIIDDVITRVGVNPLDERTYGDERGIILVKHLEISNIGGASELKNNFLEDRVGEELFNICCPHFLPRQRAYDGGKYHRDLFVDHDGTVYTCGNHAYPVGNINHHSLSAIIDGVNSPEPEGMFANSRKVFRTLLLLSENEDVGRRAVGEALRLSFAQRPEVVQNLRTQCGACKALGTDRRLQDAFLSGFRRCYLQES